MGVTALKRFLSTGVAISALVFGAGHEEIAHAGDLPVKAPPAQAQPLPAIYNWSGFYAGLNSGAAWGSYDPQMATNSDKGVIDTPSAAVINSFGNQSIKPFGFSGGAQAGYNWQVGNWVAGIEGDFSYLHLSGAATTFVPYALPSTATAQINAYGNANWLATLRPRIGWAVNNWLLYATGGVAVTNFKDDFVLTGVTADGTSIYQQSSHLNNIPLGYAVGGGFETAINEKWSVKAEYLYIDFGRFTATQTATNDPVLMPTQSADLKANLLRVGLNYRWDAADATSAYANAEPPIAVKAPPLAPLWNKSDWEFDVGVRAWWSNGTMGAPNPVLTTAQGLSSRLIWSDLDALSGETYGRIDHVSGWFVKGFLGAGGIYSGKMNDEDFPYPGKPDTAYSNTVSSTTGSIGYATIDLGYSLLRSPGAKFGPFVGYNYYTQHVNAFGCTQIAAGISCPATPPNYLILSQDDSFNSLRVGLSAEYMLTDKLKFVGDAAYLPWVGFSGIDNHNARALVTAQSSNDADGAMLEALLSYNITDSWNVGVGGRYWVWNTHNGNETFTFYTNGSGPPVTMPARFSTERYGVFLQSGYHWGDTDPAAVGSTAMPVKAPIVAAGSMNWTGFYVGGYVGGGWSDANWSDPFGTTISPSGAPNIAGFGDVTHATGPLGGGRIGANWQIGQWVLGAEADASAADFRGDNTCFSGIGGINCEHIVKGLETVTGRLGYAWNRSLLYAKGGGAWAETTYNLNGNTNGSLSLGTGSSNATASGWVAGVGIEYALTDNWTTNFEYDHIGLDSVTVPFPTVAVINTQSISVRQSINILKLGVNYKFDWSRFIVANNN